MTSGVKARLAAGVTAGALMLSVAGPAVAAAPQTTTGNLIAALNNISVEIDNLEALNDLTINDVQVVNVEDVLNGNNVEALNNSLNRNDVEIDALQNFLNNNDVITDSLNNNQVLVTDVVAIDVLSGGDVIVFVQ